MITIDAGNEIVAVICLFLICLGLAFVIIGGLVTIVQVRAYEHERKRQLEIRKMNLSEVVR
ncbi:MAG TPA: hypothetical protein PKC67_02475 [Kiritimatiellia bacterium]|nr:hypothetical protein [Kiritimatiellia bacterium]HMP33191.1 hypothetical protein [Kiritimatiellia bacterium]